MIKKKDKKNIDSQEIKSQLSESRKELLNLRFKKISGQLENTSQFKKAKRKIAHLLTIANIDKGKNNA